MSDEDAILGLGDYAGPDDSVVGTTTDFSSSKPVAVVPATAIVPLTTTAAASTSTATDTVKEKNYNNNNKNNCKGNIFFSFFCFLFLAGD